MFLYYGQWYLLVLIFISLITSEIKCLFTCYFDFCFWELSWIFIFSCKLVVLDVSWFLILCLYC